MESFCDLAKLGIWGNAPFNLINQEASSISSQPQCSCWMQRQRGNFFPLLTALPEHQSCVHFNQYELLIQCNSFQQGKYLQLPINSAGARKLQKRVYLRWNWASFLNHADCLFWPSTRRGQYKNIVYVLYQPRSISECFLLGFTPSVLWNYFYVSFWAWEIPEY